MSLLTKEEIKEVFINSHLEENYNFLEEDLIKLANAFTLKVAPKIAQAERAECIEFVRSLNGLVADSLEAKRGKL
ncbi:hypothetical protein UFOVP239_49 [uncultured Caudovirales phage]|uniref:Uncharacterized protein n=1 Tax=uncultured Caudovirales phage TaxID=2100421 RepID=A0A6J7WQP5_9CAUD|nr:hypothetical protein UFOVP239_49 [uncultured Caudovirales phage]